MYDRRIPSDGGFIEFTVFESDDVITCSGQNRTYGQLLAQSWVQAANSPNPDRGEQTRPFLLLRASPDRGHPIRRPPLQISRNNECVFLPVLSSAISTFDNTAGRQFNDQAARRAEANADMCSRSAVPAPPTIEGKPIVDNLYPFLVETEEFQLQFDQRSPLLNDLDVPNKPISHQQPYNVVAVGYCVAIKFISTGDYTIHAEALGSDRLGGGSRYQSEVTYRMRVN